MSLIQMICVVLLIMECLLSVVLIFENFRQNSFGLCLTIMVNSLAIALNAHTSTMDCVELVFDIG